MTTRAQREPRPYTDLGWPSPDGPWPPWNQYHVTVHGGHQKISIW
ncbi:hypothetical protein ACIGXA_39950 [Streptomyces fildesensis]|uniref:Uncharacterized protein n=1 Tax=Streptomyces fildesensis TaxID=375757 RepID=A0ABW8CJQ4_9ACTN